MHDVFILILAALAAGVANSIVGGGSFISFPALLLTGVPPIQANATNTVAVWPGLIAGMLGYRREVAEHLRFLPRFTIVGVAGGLVGARILLRTPQSTFMRLVPWLLLVGSVVFLFSPRITAWIQQRTLIHPRVSSVMRAVTIVLLFITAIYVGYFGAGAAILVAAVFALMGLESMYAINGLRTYLVSVANLVAIVTFVAAGAIVWPQALVMVAGTAVGGYGGAHFARKMHPELVRRMVIALGFLTSAYFFFRAYA